jgi:hypothetical protein
MSIRIKLVEDQVLVIDADADAWDRAYQEALEKGGVVKVHDAQGRTLAINPRQILFWEEAPDAQEPTPGAAARQAQPA